MFIVYVFSLRLPESLSYYLKELMHRCMKVFFVFDKSREEGVASPTPTEREA